MTTGSVLGFLAILAGIAAVFKIIFSGRGRVGLPGFNVSWGR